MKIFKIENKEGRIFYVRDKKHFCEKFNLTPRLLEYTLKGSSKTRWQEWHKDFKIVEKCSFVEAIKGDITLWDSGTCGFVAPITNKTAEDRLEGLSSRIGGRIIISGDTELVDTKKINPSLAEALDELESTKTLLKKALREKQGLHDKLLILNRLGREQYRYENLSDVILKKFDTLIKSSVPVFGKIERTNLNKEAILMLSDLHIGQWVEETNNTFDLETAYIRLGNIFDKFITQAEGLGISKVTVACLGDFIHAQSVMSKPDMKLSAEFPEVQASIECFKLLAHNIDKLVTHFDVDLIGVVGNESRFSNHYVPSNLQKEAKNNMDALIFFMLKERYSDNTNVNFLNDGEDLEVVTTIQGHNIYMTHGNGGYIKHMDLENSLTKINDRLSPIYGDISAMLLGHIHSTLITNRVFRNSSLVGSNAYSNHLGFSRSTASQNMLVVTEDQIYGFPLLG